MYPLSFTWRLVAKYMPEQALIRFRVDSARDPDVRSHGAGLLRQRTRDGFFNDSR